MVKKADQKCFPQRPTPAASVRQRINQQDIQRQRIEQEDKTLGPRFLPSQRDTLRQDGRIGMGLEEKDESGLVAQGSRTNSTQCFCISLLTSTKELAQPRVGTRL
ncbi:hypothetical protein O181_057403 [Austropuccinia psidii MF-1]|uniref:Uncharacterized protein n=1 Tax=Austropuccinia psidii MF-1 TaxID=1389203 RepID=A0A9Q3HUG3_9BASI|nr:hypothetical protein [Austropuccinia psidii MF-1]